MFIIPPHTDYTQVLELLSFDGGDGGKPASEERSHDHAYGP